MVIIISLKFEFQIRKEREGERVGVVNAKVVRPLLSPNAENVERLQSNFLLYNRK